MKTSVSDYTEYKNICLRAATDDEVYKTFRQHYDYTPILEHVTEELGQRYVNEIEKHELFKPEYLEIARKNDIEGTPILLDYQPPFTNVCPSTMRYLKTTLDLFHLFDTLDNLNIIEIGAGYGGQCKMIHNMFKPKSYTIVDLQEPLNLIQKYLRGVPNIIYETEETLQEGTYDLIISNFAFSECDRTIQNSYIEKAIKNTQHGYIIFNDITKYFNIDSLTKDEFKNIIKCYEIPEVPASGPNVVLHW